MLKGLREDEHSKIIMEKTLADAKKGWMSTPVLLSEDDIDRFVLSPRFCIAQGRVLTAWPATRAPGLLRRLSGVDATGQQKFRAADDFTRSDVNAQTAPTEKLTCDTLDAFCEILRTMAASHGHEVCGCVLRAITFAS